MMYDLQKASVGKRISAALFDFILLATLAVAIAFLISVIVGYDNHTEKLEALQEQYEQAYGVDFDIKQEEYNKLSEEDRQYLDDAYAAFGKDEEVAYIYTLLTNLMLVMTSLSIFLSYLILEFSVPLFFGNGQTLGKKIFGIGVMRTEGIRLDMRAHFIRILLGKYTVETMVPILMLFLIWFGNMALTGVIVIAGIFILEIYTIVSTKTNSAIHDLFSDTVTVDIQSQMIFESREELIAYKERIAAERAERSPY